MDTERLSNQLDRLVRRGHKGTLYRPDLPLHHQGAYLLAAWVREVERVRPELLVRFADRIHWVREQCLREIGRV